MRHRKLISLLLCGLVVGILFYLLNAATLALFGEEFLSVLETAPAYPQLGGEYFFTVDLLMGVWVMWLYSAISPRYGAKPATAIFAGIAWWAIKSLQSAHWIGLGFLPVEGGFLLLAISLVSAASAVLAGAFLYDRVAA